MLQECVNNIWFYLHLYLILITSVQAETCNFIKKETLAQVFSCKFCEMVKNTFFTEHLWMAAPVKNQMLFENKTFTDVYFLRHFVWK